MQSEQTGLLCGVGHEYTPRLINSDVMWFKNLKKKTCMDYARAKYLYCCLVSHLPAFVSRSLVARTLIMFRNSTKLTCRERKTPSYLSTSAHNEIIRFLVLCRCTETALC